MSVWQEVRDLITGRKSAELTDRVIALTDAERAEVAKELPGFLKELRTTALEMARESWGRDNGYGSNRDNWPSWARTDTHWEIREAVSEALAEFGKLLRVTGAGTISGPAAAAAWLTRREFDPRWEERRDFTDVIRVLTARPVEWQADVAARLAEKIRTGRDRVVPLVLALLRASGAEPPKHDPLVIAWLSAGVVRDDPLMGTMLPRIFEAEGAGRALMEERLDPRPTPWLAAVKRLLAAGKLSRAELLDGCVSRFLRGGDAVNLRFFVRLHELVDPAPEESAGRARDYLRLLPAAPGPVADMALAQVRRTGPHDSADVAEAIGALTFRAEAKLARAGLTWLDKSVRTADAPVEELAQALVTAFAHTSFDVRRRAAELALKHARLFAPHATLIADAVPLLPADLGEQVAATFGGDAAGADPELFTPGTLPARTEPGPFPEPALGGWNISTWVDTERWLAYVVAHAGRDRAALREQLAPSFTDSYPYLYGQERWHNSSDWIAALAKEVISPGTDPGMPDPEPVDPWAHTSFSVHVGVLSPEKAAELERQYAAEQEESQASAGAEISDADVSAAEVSKADISGADISGADVPEAEDAECERAFGELPDHVRAEIFRQLEEIGVSAERIAAMRDGLPMPPEGPDEPHYTVQIGYSGWGPMFGEPRTPDPAVEFRRRHRIPEPQQVSPPDMFLLHRLSELYLALRAGTLPPVLLSTPTVMSGHLDPGVLVDRLKVCAAAGVEPLPADLQQALLRVPRGSHPEAAERAAEIGSPAGASVATWLAGGGLPDPEAGFRWGYVEGASEYFYDEREPGHVGQVRLRPVLRAEPTGHELIDGLLAEPSPWRWDEHGGAMGWWPAVLPSHREVVAVNYLPHLLYQWNHPGVYPPYLAALADADGPVGDATAIILAYFLAERSPDAVPLLLRMAARGDLPAEAVGRQLALLIRRTWFEGRPVLACLTEAARQGGHEQVWEILRSMLPVLLPEEDERPTVVYSEAVALAADVAAWVKARGEIPAVSAHAASGRNSRFARECVRLRDQLTRM
ncbi:hypothetical protein Aph01nite_34820 [Acrocarpospora phusangensis]|uniref:DUF7824 domain-containing protein n=1 Tax=Acrocarpospora phusangensis TaxID=1070424 RepID=A0A919UP24_9ACTN|nr:DUF6493 family protein [Acrocarpospora phusangensis]GIH25172.1 hypothetical protein Aph01nite_34820 [Acrocarpospora phusangensis]